MRIKYDKDLNQEGNDHRWLLACYRRLFTLETTLGPAILDMSVDSHCLRFHPSSFKAKYDVEINTGSSWLQE